MASEVVVGGGSALVSAIAAVAAKWFFDRNKDKAYVEGMVLGATMRALKGVSDQLERADARIDNLEFDNEKLKNDHAECETRVNAVRQEFEDYMRAHPHLPTYTQITRIE